MAEEPAELSDQQLIVTLNAGDDAAFELLYQRYRSWVLKMAWRVTRHEQDSLGVLQETFVYFAGKFSGFELTSKMTTFLYPVVRNHSIAVRRKRMRAAGEDRDLGQLLQPLSAASCDQDEFDVLLEGLSDAHHEIVLLRFVDDLSHTEIASLLEIPVGTVKSRLHHAPSTLRQSAVVRYRRGPDV